MPTTYYVANDEYMDGFYGDQHPVCVPESTLLRLASSWGIDIADMMEQVHEASQREIETYGIEDA